MSDTLPQILFVEGHPRLRDVLSQLLDLASDFTTVVARDGVECVAKAGDLLPNLILTGLRMPRMDGYETMRVLQSNSHTANIPIIVLSTWSGAGARARALSAGANEYIELPVDMDRLISKIKKYI